MSDIFKTIPILIWFALSSVLLTNAFETYSETDQLAEESVGGYNKEEHNEETTTVKTQMSPIKESNVIKEESTKAPLADDNDPIDPLQKILPLVKFNCKGKSEGYYGDNEFCELFHFCKTNGFRFTFMCPPESYYNEKVMACEFNTTLSKCVEEREQRNQLPNKVSNSLKETLLKDNKKESVEVYQKSSSHIETNTEKSEPLTTTTKTVETTKADPYLTRRKTNNGWKPKTSFDSNKTKNLTKSISEEMRSRNQININDSKENINQTIAPFNGFRKLNRNKNQIKNRNITQNEVQTVSHSSKNKSNSSNNLVRIPSNAEPILKSMRPQIINNANQQKNRSRSKIASATPIVSTSTTTTAHPSLLSPPVGESITDSPFDYFTPIFNSDNNFENSDFFPLSLHKRPETQINDKNNSNKRKSVMTQNYFNSIRHSTKSPNTQKESQIEETLKQTETNPELNSKLSDITQEVKHSSVHHLNRSPLFNSEPKEFEAPDKSYPSESQIQEIIEKIKQMNRNSNKMSEYSEGMSSVKQNEDMGPIEGPIDSTLHTGRRERREKEKPKKFLTIPLLVPTGVSKNDLRRKLSSTLLKPTVLPLTESGEQMSAYVLQIQGSEDQRRKKSNKHRSKRQTFNWSPFSSNPYLSHSYYLPMSSIPSPVYSNFHNNYHLGRHLPINTFRERSTYGLNPAAQQSIPYYTQQRQNFYPNFIGNNFYRDNNIYDLSEFSDFYENPFDKKSVPLMANDMSPYRSVSLKRPGFKRPPLRNRIPEPNKIEATKNYTKTTSRPLNSMPVSPRPYSHSIMKEFLPRNNNPFSDFGDQSLNEAIKAFDNSEDHLQALNPDFEDKHFFQFNSPEISNDFIPITPKTHTFADTLNGKSSRVNTFAYGRNNYVADDFPPIPRFGDPEYRLPFANIPDPTLTNLGQRFHSDKRFNKESVQRKQDNSSLYSTPYLPEIFNTNTENQSSNETERNPNHNYDNVVDREELKTALSVQSKIDSGPIEKSILKWDNIVGQYHKHNNSDNTSQISVNEKDSKDQKDSHMINNQRYISYGTRLNGNKYSQNPEISVKTSVSSVSSVSLLEPEASNQVMISRKLGTSLPSSQELRDKEKRIEELYNQRVFDRLFLFNYYNHLNSQKSKTTTPNPIAGKYPSTSHWSIRGWTGQYYPHSIKSQTITTTNTPPVGTTNSNVEYLQLFESEEKNSETTTQSITLVSEMTSESTEKAEPPYKRIFSSQLGETFHSNKYNNRVHSLSQKTRSEISNYLSSLTTSTTTKTI